jgi:hypothetical protein
MRCGRRRSGTWVDDSRRRRTPFPVREGQGAGMAGRAQVEAARSIRRSLKALSKEAETADLGFVAYILSMAIMELDDVIAPKPKPAPTRK